MKTNKDKIILRDIKSIINIKEYSIYALIDPRNNEVRYVGATYGLLSTRLISHLCEGKHKKGTYKRNWIKELIALNIRPKISLLEICFSYNWQEREKYWIKQFENLTNSREGGVGVFEHSLESIERAAIKKSKPVIQLDLNLKFIKEHESIKHAAQFIGARSSTSITEVLSGRNLTAKGFHFVYKENYNEDYYIDLSKTIPFTKTKIINIELINGEIKSFKSIVDCSKFLNMSDYWLSILFKKNDISSIIKFNTQIKYIKRII